MGVLGDALNNLFNAVQDLFIFFIAFTILVFIAGQWFGMIYSKSEIFWWPIYLLAFVMVIKILIDIGRAGKKKAEKK